MVLHPARPVLQEPTPQLLGEPLQTLVSRVLLVSIAPRALQLVVLLPYPVLVGHTLMALQHALPVSRGTMARQRGSQMVPVLGLAALHLGAGVP